MKLWGRKRHLHKDGEFKETAAIRDAGGLQRDTVNHFSNNKIFPDRSSFQENHAWKQASPMPLALPGMSTTVDGRWDKSLSSWKDPTVTSTPLSHYKTASAPSGEVDSIAIIKNYLTPLRGADSSSAEPGSNLTLDVASRHSNPTKTSFEATPLQRMSFSSPKAVVKNTSVAKSPFIGRQVTEPYPLPPTTQTGHTRSLQRDGSETGKPQTSSTISLPETALTSEKSEISKLPLVPKLQLAKPGRQLVKAPQNDKIFRSLATLQRLNTTAGNPASKVTAPSQKADTGAIFPSPSSDTRSPIAANPGQIQSQIQNRQLSSTDVNLKNITQDTPQPIDISLTVPLVGDRQEIQPLQEIQPTENPVLPKTLEQPDNAIHEATDKPHIQRESVVDKPLPFSRKIGAPIKQTPDSAVSFSNLGSPNYAVRPTLPIGEHIAMPVTKKIDYVRPATDSPAPLRQIPKLGPIPLQRLNVAKKQGGDSTKTANTNATAVKAADSTKTANTNATAIKANEVQASQPKSSAKDEGREKIGSGDFSGAPIPQPDLAMAPLLGFNSIQMNIRNADLLQDDMAYPSTDMTQKPLQAESFTVQRVPITSPEADNSGSWTKLPMSNDNPVFRTLSKDFAQEPSSPNAQIAGGSRHFPTEIAGENRQAPKPFSEISKKPFTNSVSPTPASVSPLKWETSLSAGNLQVQRTQKVSSGIDVRGNSLPYNQVVPSIGEAGKQSDYNFSHGQGSGFFSASPGQMTDSPQGNLLLQRKPLDRTDLKSSIKYPARSYYLPKVQKQANKETFSDTNDAQALQRFKMPNIGKQLGSVTKLLGNQFFGTNQSSTSDSDTGDDNDKGTAPNKTQSANPILDLSQDDLRRLAARVYPHISQKIKAEIERDRERAGMITGLHR